MKYLLYILIGLVTATLFYLVVINRDQLQPISQQTANTTSENNKTKTDEQGQVSVKVTPQTLNGAQWKFDVVFDTHSVDLNHDLMQIAQLTDDQGNMYKPITWKGAEPGGHHREGIFVFNAINPAPSSIELKIKNVGGIPERSFKWNLK